MNVVWEKSEHTSCRARDVYVCVSVYIVVLTLKKKLHPHVWFSSEYQPIVHCLLFYIEFTWKNKEVIRSNINKRKAPTYQVDWRAGGNNRTSPWPTK